MTKKLTPTEAIWRAQNIRERLDALTGIKWEFREGFESVIFSLVGRDFNMYVKNSDAREYMLLAKHVEMNWRSWRRKHEPTIFEAARDAYLGAAGNMGEGAHRYLFPLLGGSNLMYSTGWPKIEDNPNSADDIADALLILEGSTKRVNR